MVQLYAKRELPPNQGGGAVPGELPRM